MHTLDQLRCGLNPIRGPVIEAVLAASAMP
jgi:hypothetical protein